MQLGCKSPTILHLCILWHHYFTCRFRSRQTIQHCPIVSLSNSHDFLSQFNLFNLFWIDTNGFSVEFYLLNEILTVGAEQFLLSTSHSLEKIHSAFYTPRWFTSVIMHSLFILLLSLSYLQLSLAHLFLSASFLPLLLQIPF